MLHLVSFLVSTLVLTIALFVAMKLTGVSGSFLHVLLAAAIASLVGLVPVPFIGALLPVVVLVLLLEKWTSGEVWPDIVLMVIVAWGLTWVFSLLVLAGLLKTL